MYVYVCISMCANVKSATLQDRKQQIVRSVFFILRARDAKPCIPSRVHVAMLEFVFLTPAMQAV